MALLQPASPEAASNLASAYKDAGQHEAALASYARALALRPAYPDALANYAHGLSCVADWRACGGRAALFARVEADVRADLAAGRLPSVQPFHAMVGAVLCWQP